MDDVNRRDFIKTGVVGIAAATTMGTGLGVASRAGAADAKQYPAVEIAGLDTLAPGAELAFEYPDVESPAVLLRLKTPVDGGIGPNGDIVAYSMLCTHKGCQLNYLSDRQMLVCPCHWSSFDPAKGGRLIIGQASESLPQVKLDIVDGTVRAVGMSGLIYGRHTNIL